MITRMNSVLIRCELGWEIFPAVVELKEPEDAMTEIWCAS